jgi:squalene synthase HpnD
MSSNANPTSAEITASSGSNLALAFFCLPPDKRRSMSIFYAFCRVIDDIADSDTLPLEEKRAQLQAWREDIDRAYRNETPLSPLGIELGEVIHKHNVTHSFLEDILVGVETDLTKTRQQTFAELERYCYGVASAVGLVSIEIFGYTEPQTRDYAIALGMAFQLTNILRDVKKDASLDRIYLPLDEIEAWGLTQSDVIEGRWSPKMEQFLRFQHHRARHYFAKSWRLLHPNDRPNLIAAEIMREVYSGILDKIERNGFNVFTEETRLNKLEKAWKIYTATRREKNILPTPPPPKKVLVLGAGYAGLAAATELALNGHTVTVLESRSILGGRAHSFSDPKTGQETDNAQHILMGCYHESLELLRTLGVHDRLLFPTALDVPYLSENGHSALKAPGLPAPWHLLVALLGFKELTWVDRWQAFTLCNRLRFGQRPASADIAELWLKSSNQSPNLIRAVWEPLCLAALNEPLSTASASLFATVIERSLLGSADDSKILLSRVGLSELFAPEVEQLLNLCGGRIVRNAVVSKLQFQGDLISRVETQDGTVYEADHVISALPWAALRTLLPQNSALAGCCKEIEDSPIIGIQIWLDSPILDRPFVGLLDSPLHWVFSSDHIHEIKENAHSGYRYALVISGAREWIDKPADEIEAMAMRELHRFLPLSRETTVLHRLIYKSRSATFATTPETEKLRPNATTEWDNFWLAGDWINTGLPATIESAIQSGRTAARFVDSHEA